MVQHLVAAPQAVPQHAVLALARALAEAREEAARTGQLRYIRADAAATWVATATPTRDGPCYCVYPGGRVEPRAARAPRRLA